MELEKTSDASEKQAQDVTLNSDLKIAEEENVEKSDNLTSDNSTPDAKEEVNSVSAQNEKKYCDLNKSQIVEKMDELLENSTIDAIKDDILLLKAAFYAIRKKEIEKEKSEFLEKGNEESAFAPLEDEQEIKIKDLLASYKAKRADRIAEIENTKKENLEKKNHILDELKKIIDDSDNINKHYQEFQQLQQEFKTIGEVPAESVSDLWKTYQVISENFYDLLKINKELRDYDFKKNLEIKQNLCALAEELTKESDVVIAFRKLQDLHNKWRETGPVSKELREELWNKFKESSTSINKNYQSFFEERKGKEKENEESKTLICEKIEAINFDELKNYSAWDEITNQIKALQEEWKTLGFASRKVNNALFARFRKSCDEFFEKKANFFKNMKDELSVNLQKKIELCEKAESLKASTDWKKTTDEFIALQKEWKTIGPVIKKQSDIVWKRFITACDAYFEEKNKQTTNTRQVEHANLKAKKELIEAVKALIETKPEDAPEQLRALMKEWQGIGFVPYKEKDKVYQEYQQAVSDAYDKLDIKETKSKLSNYESTVAQLSSDGDKIYREREKLVRAFDQKKNELKTYENNLGFFNSKSKSGDSMLKEMEKRIQRAKEDLEMIEKKISLIDSKL